MSEKIELTASVHLEKDKPFNSWHRKISPTLWDCQFKIKKLGIGTRAKIDLSGISQDVLANWGIRYFLAHIFYDALRTWPASEVKALFGTTIKAIEYLGTGAKGRAPLTPEAKIAKSLAEISDKNARDEFIKATFGKKLPEKIQSLLDEYLKAKDKKDKK